MLALDFVSLEKELGYQTLEESVEVGDWVEERAPMPQHYLVAAFAVVGHIPRPRIAVEVADWWDFGGPVSHVLVPRCTADGH